MKVLERVCLYIIAIISCVSFTSCLFAPVEAKKIEEVQGTYKLTEYVVTEGDSSKTHIDDFEYFYFVMKDDSSNGISFIYKEPEEDLKKDDTSYIVKYKSGSTKYVEEIKIIKFLMPCEDQECMINYFTVSLDSQLICQKFIYGKADSNGATKAERIIKIVFTKISSDCSFGFVEQMLGLSLQ